MCENFLSVWHYHPELELVYIVESSGSLFVGDAIESFEGDSLVLLGSNLAHRWLNDPAYFQSDPDSKAESLTIHFAPDFLKTNLKDIPEFRILGNLMDQSKLGILFFGPSTQAVKEQMFAMEAQDEFSRLISFLEILRRLARENAYRFLASPGYVAQVQETNDRFGRVHAFIMNNFQRDISLDEVSEIALMNKSAFCRYFKKTTKKSFSRYLHEIRIGYACKLLSEQDEIAISEVGFECGYNNISNFNRQFKLITGYPPSAYLKKYRSA
jgi:AraC-like DNA-binding protein